MSKKGLTAVTGRTAIETDMRRMQRREIDICTKAPS